MTENNSNYVNELNAQALAANLADLRSSYDARLLVIENKLTSLESLLESQTRVLQEALVMAYGKGSTVQE